MKKDFRLVNSSVDEKSKELLESFYVDGTLPAEKKPFLIDLENSFGPYLALSDGSLILDAASQIASLAFGFNPIELVGVLNSESAILNNTELGESTYYKEAYSDLLRRVLNKYNYKIHFCNSGSEANEIALGAAYEQAKKRGKGINQIIAFKGSFHGRMKIALEATWNEKKRLPFSWEENSKNILYFDFPEILKEEDEVLKNSELEILGKIEGALALGKVFAIIIEPMQCEGGERYSSSRFQQNLAKLSAKYGVSLIYDEIQTGFALSGKFFWHQNFDLKDENGLQIFPDYITCAKKAQLGLVISKEKIPFKEAYSQTSLVRGFYQALNLEQSLYKISKLEILIKERLNTLITKFKDHIGRPRASGLAFGFDFFDVLKLNEAINKRFEYGLLFYSAGENSLRFRLNLSFRESDLDLLFLQLERLFDDVLCGKKASLPQVVKVEKSFSQNDLNSFLKEFFLAKALFGEEKDKKVEILLEQLKSIFSKSLSGLETIIIDSTNISGLLAEIEELQIECYEPTRRDEKEVYKNIVNSKLGFGVGICKDSKLKGICFLGDLISFKHVSGVDSDPYLAAPNILYAADMSISKDLRGLGLGMFLRYFSALIALKKGATAIHGRNRDIYASSMIRINSSLGAIPLKRLKDDYRDKLEFRDCIYYRIPLRLENKIEKFSFIKRNSFSLVNKLTHSNFLTKNFLDDLSLLLSKVPSSLRHVYTASGESECVDKIVKSLWYKGVKRKSFFVLSGSNFGEGSILSRELSGVSRGFFDVDILSSKELISALTQKVKTLPLAVFVDLQNESGTRLISREELVKLKALCSKLDVPLVYNETKSLGLQYSKDFFASFDDEISPNIFFAHLGGQMGFVFLEEKYFCKEPLLLISTWDGDEYSLASFVKNIRDSNVS